MHANPPGFEGNALHSHALAHPYLVGLVAAGIGLVLLLRGVRAVQWTFSIVLATSAVVLIYPHPHPFEPAMRWVLIVTAGLVAAVVGLVAPSLWLAMSCGFFIASNMALAGFIVGSWIGAAVLGVFGFLVGFPIGWRMTPALWRAICIGVGTSSLWFGWMALAGLPQSPWIQGALAGASVLFGAWAFRFQPGQTGDPSSSRDAETREVVKLARRALETSKN